MQENFRHTTDSASARVRRNGCGVNRVHGKTDSSKYLMQDQSYINR